MRIFILKAARKYPVNVEYPRRQTRIKPLFMRDRNDYQSRAYHEATCANRSPDYLPYPLKRRKWHPSTTAEAEVDP